MIEGYVPKQDVVDMLLDVKNALMEEHLDPDVILNNVNQFVDNKLKEVL